MRRNQLIVIPSFILFWFVQTTVIHAQIGFGNKERNKPIVDLNYANPGEYEIAEIRVEGADNLDENALISISGLKVGDKITIPGDDISNAIRKLWKQGLIEDISIGVEKIDLDKVYLVINLSELPRLTRFTFNGINSTQESDLKDLIEDKIGRIITPAVRKNIELSVRNYFNEKGYLNAEIQVNTVSDSLISNGSRLTIDVKKNSKVRINRIRIIGNEDIADSKLKKKLKKTNEFPRFHVLKAAMNEIPYITPQKVGEFFTETNELSREEFKEWLGTVVKPNVFASSKFLRKEYKNDKKLLVDYYNTKGYRDADILGDSIYKHSQNTINIDLNVLEGDKYYFRNITWKGNYVYGDSTLSKVLGIKKGDVYDMSLVQKKLQFDPTGLDISSLYMDNGYLFFNIDPVEIRVSNDSIDLEMRISEGTQATIRNVEIVGNERTNDHVVRRELRTLPGDKFNRSLIIRTQRELSQLGYFDPEQISPNVLPNPADGTVDIEWQLVEKSSDQVELSGGWGGAFGFVGTVGLVFNNFSMRNIVNFKKWRPLPFWDGQRLQLLVQANGKQFQNYSISFMEPWLGGRKPNAFSVSFNHSVNRIFSVFDTDLSDNGYLKLYSVSMGLGRRVRWPDDYFTLSNSISYTLYELKDFFSSQQSLGFSTGEANSITFNTTLARNSIDQPMYPRSGSNISLSVSLTPPYSLWRDISPDAPPEERYKFVEYHKWMFDSWFYQRLFSDLVINFRAHIGYLGTYGEPAGPFERFILGGDGLAGNNFLLGTDIIGLRGYPNNSINPVEQGTGITGGTIFNKFVMELRYPISLNPQATIYLLTFAEAGNNWNNFNAFNPFDLYRSAGVGARIFMPAFGLLGIDWGYGFNTLPGRNERSGAQFHFSIGQQIR